MRAKHLSVVGLALLLSACSGGKGGSHAPPPLDQQLLAGKWKNVSDAQFIAGYEFASDGTAKVLVAGMEQPIPARYTWSGERTLDLEYKTGDVLQAYKAAAKGYKEKVTERVKNKQLYERAAASMIGAVQDELPAKETFQVALSAQPRLLILVNPSGLSQSFEQPD